MAFLELGREREADKLKQLAVAVRVANLADKNGWRKFMNQFKSKTKTPSKEELESFEKTLKGKK